MFCLRDARPENDITRTQGEKKKAAGGQTHKGLLLLLPGGGGVKNFGPPSRLSDFSLHEILI